MITLHTSFHNDIVMVLIIYFLFQEERGEVGVRGEWIPQI